MINDEQVKYTESICTVSKTEKSFTESLLDSHDGLVEILESMTEFNPYFRPTAKELLKNRIFDEIRMESIE